MGTEWIHDLKVTELKDELKKRGLPVSGKKAELVERLEAYINENEAGEEGAPVPAAKPEKDEQQEEEEEEGAKEEAEGGKEEGKGKGVGGAEEEGKPRAEEAAPAAAEAAPAAAAADEAGEGEEEEGPSGAAAAGPASAGEGEKEEQQQGAVAMEEEEAAAPAAEQPQPEGSPAKEEPAASAEEEKDEAAAEALPAAEGAGSPVEEAPAAAEGGPAAAAGRQQQRGHEEEEAAGAMDEDRVELDYGESDHEEQHAAPAAAPAPAADKRGSRAEDSGRKREREAAPSADRRAGAAAAERPAKAVRREGSVRGSGPEAGERPDPEAVPGAEEPATRALRIDNFVRPFTEGQVRALLNQHGFVKALWMPSIKTHCYAIFENKAQAESARKSTWQLQWPATNPKRLAPRFVPLGEAEAAVGKGSGNPDFRVARTDEDEDEPAAAAAAGGSVERSGGAAEQGIDRRLVERRRSREWNRERPADLEGPEGAGEPEDLRRGGSAGGAVPMEGVTDLREVLKSRRSSGREVVLERGASRGVLERLDSRRSDPRDAPASRELPPERRAPPPREPSPQPEKELSLDELFRKTQAKPCIYWLPLTEEQITEKKAKAAAAAAAAAQQGAAAGPAANGATA